MFVNWQMCFLHIVQNLEEWSGHAISNYTQAAVAV